MPNYIISYDLRKVRNYDQLIDGLRLANFVSPLRSVWLGHSGHGAPELREVLLKYMDDDDGLLVVEIKPYSDWSLSDVNDPERTVQWLRSATGH